MLVSVIIPTRNRSAKLKRAIRSVQKQTIQNWELLIVDDKSEEDIESITKEISDSRIIYLRNEKDISNANVCRNIGLQTAEGKYIAMLDSDDEWLPNHLELKIASIDRYKCDGVFGSAYVDDGEIRTLRLSRPRGSKELMLDYLLTTGRAPTPTHVYKSECAKHIGWDEELNRHQDFDFSARFAEQYSFVACEEPTVIIHWERGVERTADLKSQETFIRKNTQRISPHILVKYLTEVYSIWYGTADLKSNKTLSYFKKLAISNIRFMSYADYQLIYHSQSSIQKLVSRFRYVFNVLFG